MIRYINKFVQSWKLATSLALFSTLLTFSSYSFSQNLVTNPGFESGTTGWTLEQDASAQYTESGGRSGDRLTHWSSAASYTAETTQTVSGLTAGTYRLSLYTVGGATSGAWLWAYCDGQTYTSTIPSSPWGSWAQVTVDNISVSGGGNCTLGITTENSEWSSFDDVVFEQVSGGGNAITVRAVGTSGAESVSLQVGGTTVQTWTLSTSMQNYEATTELDGEIRVAFTNDASGRDVQVDYIQVNGATRQAEDQSTNTGVWQDGGCGGGGYSQWMHCNGYISFGNVDDVTPTEIVIQEGTGFCDVDGSVDSNHSGYTGSGFANTDNASGTGVDWKVKVPASGNYILEWRYANGGSASRPGSVQVNGSSVETVDFPITGAWTSWTSVSANISLSAGDNTIRLQATDSAGLGNIDSLSVTGNSPQAVTCESSSGACGDGSPHATVTGAPGNYQVNGSGVGGDYLYAIRTAIDSLSSGRTSQQRVSVMADGSIGNNSISLPSHTALEVCGTMDVGNSSGKGAIQAIGVQNVAVPHLKMTGSPYFGMHFADVHGLHLGQIDLRLSGGLGIRFARDLPGSTNVRMDDVYVSGTGNHGVETWNVDGLEIGTVIARNTRYAGLLLNNTRNANIGLVDGEGTGTGTGYATLRFANENGRIGGSYPTNIFVDRVISRGGGRGFFCVSNSGGAEINHVDLASNGNNSILIENCHNVTVHGGEVNGGGEVRLAARSEFPNNSDITIANLNVFNTNVRESPCGNNVNWINVNVQGGSYNVCD